MFRSGRRDDRRGVTPVVATVVLVVLAVVIAGGLSLFVGAVADQVAEPAPTTFVSVESKHLDDGEPKNDTLVLTHESGTTLERGNLFVVVGDDVVFNRSLVGDRDGSGTVTTRLGGLIVEVNDDRFNDLNKPGTGPPGDPDGDSANVVNEWSGRITSGDRLVIQERRSTSYDVFGSGESVRVVWVAENGRTYLLADETV